jgi:hypothetical protein
LVVSGLDIWPAGPVVSTGLLSFEPGNPLEMPVVPLSRLAAGVPVFVVSTVPLVRLRSTLTLAWLRDGD